MKKAIKKYAVAVWLGFAVNAFADFGIDTWQWWVIVAPSCLWLGAFWGDIR